MFKTAKTTMILSLILNTVFMLPVPLQAQGEGGTGELQLSDVVVSEAAASEFSAAAVDPAAMLEALQKFSGNVVGHIIEHDSNPSEAALKEYYNTALEGLAVPAPVIANMAKQVSNSLRGHSPTRSLVANTAGFGFSFLGLLSYTFIVKKMSALDGGSKSLLMGAPLITGALLRLPMGWGANGGDGGKKSMAIAMSTSAFGLALISVLSELTDIETIEGPEEAVYWTWLGAGLLAGVGIATFAPGVVNTKNWYSAEHQGRAQAIFGGVSNLMPAFAAAGLSHMVSEAGYTATYAIWAGVLAVVTAVVYCNLGAPPLQLAAQAALSAGFKLPGRSFLSDAAAGFGNLDNWLYSFIYWASFGNFVSMPNMLAQYNVDEEFTENPYGLTSESLGYLIAGFITVASQSRTFSGGLSNRFDPSTVVMGSLAVATVGALSMALDATPDDGEWWAGLSAMAIGWGVTMAADFAWMAKKVPAKRFGMAAGMASALGACGFLQGYLAQAIEGYTYVVVNGLAIVAAGALRLRQGT